MHNVYDYIVIIVIIVINVEIWVIFNRFIKLGYYVANIWKSKQLQTVQPTVTHTNQDKPRAKAEAMQLPIDVLAPRLKDPPRSPGGFGSKVPDDL